MNEKHITVNTEQEIKTLNKNLQKKHKAIFIKIQHYLVFVLNFFLEQTLRPACLLGPNIAGRVECESYFINHRLVGGCQAKF